MDRGSGTQGDNSTELSSEKESPDPGQDTNGTILDPSGSEFKQQTTQVSWINILLQHWFPELHSPLGFFLEKHIVTTMLFPKELNHWKISFALPWYQLENASI
jgi:hypothetical protein